MAFFLPGSPQRVRLAYSELRLKRVVWRHSTSNRTFKQRLGNMRLIKPVRGRHWKQPVNRFVLRSKGR